MKTMKRPKVSAETVRVLTGPQLRSVNGGEIKMTEFLGICPTERCLVSLTCGNCPVEP